MTDASRRNFLRTIGAGATLSLAGAPSAFPSLPRAGGSEIDPVIVLARQVAVLKGVVQRTCERFNEVEADPESVDEAEYLKAVREDDEAFNRLHDARDRLALTPATTLAGVLEKLWQIYDGDASDQADLDALQTAIADLERMVREGAS